MLVILEQQNGSLPRSAEQVVSAAKLAAKANSISSLKALIFGSGSEVMEAAKQASFFGFSEVIAVLDDQLSQKLTLPAASLVEQVIAEEKPSMVVAGASSFVKSFLPRVAVAFDAGQASDVIGFPSKGIYRRPMFAGNIIAEVEVTTPIVFATVRTAAFDAIQSEDAACPVRELSVSLPKQELEVFVSFDTVESERPELSDAQVVVSGGRALQSKENFETILAPLADQLGAAIGASRAAVDSGYAPNDWQIGQTGKVVAPSLYIAVGISGAIQHLAGMKDSKVIVAINTDPDAPIFELADYGLVADLFEVVPELTTAISGLTK